MHYHIQTTPIWEAYREDGCPLCKIRSAREERLVGQYLSDNVMDPDFRVASNTNGFCAEHTRMLYKGQNKLGLALQLETRAQTLALLYEKPPVDKKSASRAAARIREHYRCVICSALDEIMPRYYMTVAEMFGNESEFPELFSAAHHCVEHSACLMECAAYAGKTVGAFLNTLCGGVRRDLRQTERDLRGFADCFDFKNAGARPDAQAIPRAAALMIAPDIK